MAWRSRIEGDAMPLLSLRKRCICVGADEADAKVCICCNGAAAAYSPP